jgi:hypothetical protein
LTFAVYKLVQVLLVPELWLLGYKVRQKPLTLELIESVLARDLNDLEPHLTRHRDNVKVLAELLNVRPAEIRAFLVGQLPPSCTHELQQELLAAELPC